MGNVKTETKQRIYNWAVRLVGFIEVLAKDGRTQILAHQLLRSGTSIAANYIEAQASSSRKECTNYIHHALKSANESRFWLDLLRDTHKVEASDVEVL